MIRLVSCTYPCKIKVLIGRTIYEYEASYYWCQKVMRCVGRRDEWRVFNEFKKQAKLVGKEKVR